MADEISEALKNQFSKAEKLRAQALEARAKSDDEQRRSLELRASFYEKLAALDAASIAVAVSVAVALFGKSEARPSQSLHTSATFLVVIAFFVWLSLICSITHNLIYVKIARLEAERARHWSGYIGVLSAGAAARAAGSKTADLVDQHILDTLEPRIERSTTTATHIARSHNRVMLLGHISVGSFLFAYTLVFAWVIRIWWHVH